MEGKGDQQGATEDDAVCCWALSMRGQAMGWKKDYCCRQDIGQSEFWLGSLDGRGYSVEENKDERKRRIKRKKTITESKEARSLKFSSIIRLFHRVEKGEVRPKRQRG